MNYSTNLTQYRARKATALHSRLSAIEFADGEKPDRKLMKRTVGGVFSAKKGEKLNAYKHVLKEDAKGTGKGAVIGAGAGTVAAVAMERSARKSGQLALTNGSAMRSAAKTAIVPFKRPRRPLGRGRTALIGAAIGAGAGSVYGSMKGFDGKDADRFYMASLLQTINFGRDEYGRYIEGSDGPGMKEGVAAAGAVGAGLYARGRASGAVKASSLENGVREGVGSLRDRFKGTPRGSSAPMAPLAPGVSGPPATIPGQSPRSDTRTRFREGMVKGRRGLRDRLAKVGGQQAKGGFLRKGLMGAARLLNR
jgi:hypothetical protein